MKRHCLMLAISGLLLAAVFMGCGKEAAEKTTVEPNRDVPEMDTFVEAFRMIWMAGNSNDYQTIRDSAAVLVSSGEKLTQAGLPEFHQDISEEFSAAQDTLAAALNEFSIAVQSNDTAEIDKTVDAVRLQVVAMYSLLSPEIAELEAFHDLLAPLWHESLPDEDYNAIREAIPQLTMRADALTKTTLPEKYAYLQDEFNEKSNDLVEAVENLAEVCVEDSLQNQIADKMDVMHTAYHNLVDCLE